jgi:hypothetical protein
MSRQPKYQEDQAIREQRLAVVDDYLRRGWTIYNIAKALVTNEPLAKLVAHVFPEAGELTVPQQINRVQYQCVLRDVRAIEKRFRRTVSATTAEDSLHEYVGRLDYLYEQSMRDHTDAFDYKDRVKALSLAKEVARAKALAMGVDLEPEVEQRGNTFNIGTLGQLAVLAGNTSKALSAKPGHVVEGELVSTPHNEPGSRTDGEDEDDD